MSTPLVIAVVCTEWSADASGGATFERDILNAVLGARSHHRLVVYPDCSGTRAAVEATGAADRVTFVAALREPNVLSRVLRRTSRAIRRSAAPRPFSALNSALVEAGAQCAWTLGGSIVPLDIPYVATLWDLQHRVQPWFPEVSSDGEWRERERLYPEFLKRAAAVLVGTRVGAREVAAAYGEPPGGAHVIPLPTPSFALDAGTQPMLARPVGMPTRYLLYPAQFWPHKNHITAVRALAQMDFADPPSLVLLGSDRGTRAHVLTEAKLLGVADRVVQPGFVDRATLIALYQHADALVFPSLFGPDNLPPLEAMALGCPVIVARVDGADEQIGDAGILVDGLDASGYAAAVRRLRDDPAMRAALIARGHRRAQEWTAARYVSTVLSLVDERIAPMRELWP